MMPVMARDLLESIGLLADGSRLLADRVVGGIDPTPSGPCARRVLAVDRHAAEPAPRVRGRRPRSRSRRGGTEHDPRGRHRLGHVKSGEISDEELDRVLDVLSMTSP